jgi:hypothetical protein
MDNVWTLMIFQADQSQAVVLQYRTLERAERDRDLGDSASDERVTLRDDYGRQLRLSPANTQLSLLQDVDLAAAGNLVSNVKNMVSQTVAQVRAQAEAQADPAMKGAMFAAQAQQMKGAILS